MSGLEVTSERTGDRVQVALAGEFDMQQTFNLEPELERLTSPGVSELELDMGGVTFMDSTALGLLLSTEQRLRSAGVRFSVTHPSPAVRRILEMTGAAAALPLGPQPPR